MFQLHPRPQFRRATRERTTVTSPATPVSPNRAAQARRVKSMTGFAEARAEHDGWALRVSLRSVNHRFLDLHLRLPKDSNRSKPEIRRVAARTLAPRPRRRHVARRSRGHFRRSD